MRTMTIGQVARETGIGIETVRFYEREGLLEQPARRASGYREYTDQAIKRLRFIKQAQRLGFTLREIRELLALKLNPKATRGQVKEQAQAKVEDIDQRIRELKRMKKALSLLLEACNGKGSLDGCPILEAIECSCETSAKTKS